MPPRLRSTSRPRWFGAAIALALVTAATPAGAGSDDQFSVGDWTASGEASGITAAAQGPMLIDITGRFTADFAFSVAVDGTVSDGSWVLDDGFTFWTLANGEVAATSALLHTATGAVEGDSRQLQAPSGTITSQGEVEVPGVGGIPIDSVDTIDPFELTVTRLLCNNAWGEWVFSWNSQLSEASLSPTFAGNWHAIRTPPEDETESRERLEELAPEILELRQEMMLLWQQPQDSGVPIYPAGELWSLLERAVALINEFNNLSRCDRAFFGEDVIAEYVNALTNMVVLLTNIWLDNAALDGRTPTPAELLELMTMLGAVGGIGPGAVDQDAARFTEQRLRSELQNAVAAQTDAALASAGSALLGEGP